MSNKPHLRPANNGQQPAPANVQPSPVPLQMVCSQVNVNGTMMVLLTMLTPVGQQVYFLPIDAARWLAGELSSKATPVTLAQQRNIPH